MAAMRGGRGGIEDELVGAAVQISELRQDKKRLQRALDSALLEIEDFKKIRVENSRQIQEHVVRRAETAATHAQELEDVKKNEREAIETAKKAYAELQKRNDETAKLKAELNEARAPAAEAGSAGGAVIHRRVTAMGLKPVSPGPAVAAAGAGGAEATPSRGARYAMDEGEEDSNGGAADRAEQGESGGEEEGEGEGDDDNDEEEEEEEDGKKSSGFFGWLTGSAKKRRRGE